MKLQLLSAQAVVWVPGFGVRVAPPVAPCFAHRSSHALMLSTKPHEMGPLAVEHSQ